MRNNIFKTNYNVIIILIYDVRNNFNFVIELIVCHKNISLKYLNYNFMLNAINTYYF